MSENNIKIKTDMKLTACNYDQFVEEIEKDKEYNSESNTHKNMPIEINAVALGYNECPVCHSSDMDMIHNSAVLMSNNVMEIYYHMLCNKCWKEIHFVMHVRKHEKHCRCSICEKMWDGKERNLD